MDSETLTLLLRGGHLNIAERKKRGAWPHAPLRLTDLREHLVRLVEHEAVFPCPRPSGYSATEGVFIEQRAPNSFVCIARRTFPTVEETERVFERAEDAASFYLGSYLHLPGDLDGWKVIE